jgi:hypothetical protein
VYPNRSESGPALQVRVRHRLNASRGQDMKAWSVANSSLYSRLVRSRETIFETFSTDFPAAFRRLLKNDGSDVSSELRCAFSISSLARSSSSSERASRSSLCIPLKVKISGEITEQLPARERAACIINYGRFMPLTLSMNATTLFATLSLGIFLKKILPGLNPKAKKNGHEPNWVV